MTSDRTTDPTYAASAAATDAGADPSDRPDLRTYPWGDGATTEASAAWRANIIPTLMLIINDAAQLLVLPKGRLDRHKERLEKLLLESLDEAHTGQPVPSTGWVDRPTARALYPEEIDPADRVKVLTWLGALAGQRTHLATDSIKNGAFLVVHLLQAWSRDIWAHRAKPGWAVEAEVVEANEDDDRRARAIGRDIKVFMKAFADHHIATEERAYTWLPSTEVGKAKRRVLINACLDIQHLAAEHSGLLDDETALLARNMAEVVAGNVRFTEENEQFGVAQASWDQMMLRRAMDGVGTRGEESAAAPQSEHEVSRKPRML